MVGGKHLYNESQKLFIFFFPFCFGLCTKWYLKCESLFLGASSFLWGWDTIRTLLWPWLVARFPACLCLPDPEVQRAGWEQDQMERYREVMLCVSVDWLLRQTVPKSQEGDANRCHIHILLYSADGCVVEEGSLLRTVIQVPSILWLCHFLEPAPSLHSTGRWRERGKGRELEGFFF